MASPASLAMVAGCDGESRTVMRDSGAGQPRPASSTAPPTSTDTTTISTIAIRAGDNATIVVALLKSIGYVELRIDQMQPALLEIGANLHDTTRLLQIHSDLMQRLKEKEDQVEVLLQRADNLVHEKEDPNEAIVYEAMARSLGIAWRELNKQLVLRGYMLTDATRFYELAQQHDELSHFIAEGVRTGSKSKEVIARAVNDLLDITASAVDLGTSCIAQIRALGLLNDSEDRPSEILSACLLIEKTMLRIAGSWEAADAAVRGQDEIVIRSGEDIEEKLTTIDRWVVHNERKARAVNEHGMRVIEEEGQVHKQTLYTLPSSDRASSLSSRIDTLLDSLKQKERRAERLQQFIQAAHQMMRQMDVMEVDIRNANAAMAGELAPLAKQKARAVEAEGKDILEKEALSHEERRLVEQKVTELEERLKELYAIAKQRQSAGAQQISQQISQLTSWMTTSARPFLAANGDMGSDIETAKQFTHKHKQFATEVVNRDASVIAVMNQHKQMSDVEAQQMHEFEKEYHELKQQVEQRVQLGHTFEQVHQFARDLDSSFDALSSLLTANRDYTNEKVSQQMSHVFQMIQETLGQERHQGDKFIQSAHQATERDQTLKVSGAVNSVKDVLVRHEHRFNEVTGNWQQWQAGKAESKTFSSVIEEVQAWQEEVVEIIQQLMNQQVETEQEISSVRHRVAAIRNELQDKKQKLQIAEQQATTESVRRDIQQTAMVNRAIEEKLELVEQKAHHAELQLEAKSFVKVIEELQCWQVETVELIGQLMQKRIDSVQDAEEVRQRVNEVRNVLHQKNEKLAAVEEKATTEQIRGDVQQVRLVNAAIDEKLQILDERVQHVQQQLAVERTSVNVVEEVQAWQEEFVEIIKQLMETRIESVEQAEEVKKRCADVRATLQQRKEHLAKAEQSAVSESVRRDIQQVQLVNQAIEEKITMVEEHAETMKQQLIASQEQAKEVEEVTFWQEEMVEYVKHISYFNIDTVEQADEVLEKVRVVKATLHERREQLRKAEERATTEHARRTIQKALLVNQAVQKQCEEIEERAQEIKTQLVERAQFANMLQEVQQWQERAVEVVHNASIVEVRSVQEVESVRQQVAEVKATLHDKKEQLRKAAEHATSESVRRDVQKAQIVNAAIEKRIEKVEERVEVLKQEIAQQAVAVNVIEEVQCWQEETVEIVRMLENVKVHDVKEQEEVRRRVQQIRESLQQQTAKLRKAQEFAKSESVHRQIEEAQLVQQRLEQQLQQVERQTESVAETYAQSEMSEVQKAPEILAHLKDVKVEEGTRVELAARVEGAPEPDISWTKDNVEIRDSMDYHTQYINGVASLTIEETFIEDSAVYTLRATNMAGTVESTATLTVESRETQQEQGEKPRFVRQLQNVQVQEGGDAQLDCVIIARPEPEVVWFKEEKTVQEDQRTHLSFQGDHCQLRIENVQPVDTGIYTAKARNVHGEATNFCQVKVVPRKMPPPTPPKPLSRASSVVHRAPTIQPTLCNATYLAGAEVKMAVLVQGEPRPRVQWTVDERPLRNSEEVRIVETEDGWSRLTIQNVQPRHAGMYMVVADNEAGEARTGATLHVQPPVQIQSTEYLTSYQQAFSPVATIEEPIPEMHKSTQESVSRQTLETAISHLDSIQPPAVKDRAVEETLEFTQGIAETRFAPEKQTFVDVQQKVEEESFISKQSFVNPIHTTTTKHTEEEFASTANQQQQQRQPVISRQHTHEESSVIENKNFQQQQQPHVPKTIVDVKQNVEETSGVMHQHFEAGRAPQTTVNVHQNVQEESAVTRQNFYQPPQTTTNVQQNVQEESAVTRQNFHQPPYTTTNVQQNVQEQSSVIEQQHYQQPKTTVDVKQDVQETSGVTHQHWEQPPHVPQTTVDVKQQVQEQSAITQQHYQPQPQHSTSVHTTVEEQSRIQQQQQHEQQPVQVVQRQKTEDYSDVSRSAVSTPYSPQMGRKTPRSVIEEAMVQTDMYEQRDGPRPVTEKTTRTDEEMWQNDVDEKIAAQMRERSMHESTREQMTSSQKSHIPQPVWKQQQHLQETGYWTDGQMSGYTASPTPPPVPAHRREMTSEERREMVSSTSTQPEFRIPFQNEYTVEEEECIRIECMLVGNPRPKVQWYFNDKPINMSSKFVEFGNVVDTYSIHFNPARLDHAGIYKITAENVRGCTESVTVVHVRPKSMSRTVRREEVTKMQQDDVMDRIIQQRKAGTLEHQKVEEEFGMFSYEQRRPQKHAESRLVTPPPAKKQMQGSQHTTQHDSSLTRSTGGHPPHFTQTLVSAVAAEADGAHFEGVVTGWPAPAVEWTKDGVAIDRNSLPGVQFSNIGGRVSLHFSSCSPLHAGKYMCTARNASGVATSSAQLVVRPRTIAPDFVQRLISEEVEDGERLRWAVRVTGDPAPTVTWLRDGEEIPDCEEVRVVDEGNGVHSLIISAVEMADSGQFTCLAENVAGEARSTADLVVRARGSEPGNYFHVTKVTQEKQLNGEEVNRNQTVSIENPRATPINQ